MSSKSSCGQTFTGLTMTTIKVKSYWDWLPSEIQEYIMSFVVSQQRIDARNKDSWKALCFDIFQYGQLKVEWWLGPLVLKHWNCTLYGCKGRIPGTNKHLVILGKYKDPFHNTQKEILGVGFTQALADVKEIKFFLLLNRIRPWTPLE